MTGITKIRADIMRYYISLLSSPTWSYHIDVDRIRTSIRGSLSPDQAEGLLSPVTIVEVRDFMFALGNDKAPRADGYNVEFYCTSWDVMGKHVTDAVFDFFCWGRLLRDASTTIISLVLKTDSSCKLSSYRPISCCNTVYKYIMRIIATRFRDVVPGLI